MLQPSVVHAATFLVTLACCLALVLTTKWHGRLSLDGTVGLQKFHTSPTPRIGGLAVLAGVVAGYAVASDVVRPMLGVLLVASLPAFCAGLLEDVTKRVGVRERLLATMFGGFLGWYLTGVALTRTGIPVVDDMLLFTPLAVLFTMVAIGGVANAVNIIDGFNGLAGGVLFIMFVALGLIARGAGDLVLAETSWALAAAALGFTAVNWPHGKIFLGDGGAYMLGSALAWIAVLLVMRNDSVPAWAPLVVCAYPVVEVAFSVVRKFRRTGYHPGVPDRVHMHMLVHRRLVRLWLPRSSRAWQNGMTSPFAWLYAGTLAAWGTHFARQSGLLLAGLLAAVIAYAGVYRRLTQFRWWPAPRPTPKFVAQGARAAGAMVIARPLRTAASASGAASGAASRGGSAGAWALAPAARLAALPQRGFASARAPSRASGHDFGSRARASADAGPWTLAAYALLGLSTCLVIYEPAPFELIAVPLMLASSVRLALARSRPYLPWTAALVLLLVLFCLLQLLPVLGAAQDLLQAGQYAAVTALLVMIGIHLGRLFGSGDVRFHAFVRAYCVAAVVSAVIAIVSLYLGEGSAIPESMFYAGRPKAFFKDPNVLGPYLVPAVLVLLYQASRVRALGKLLCLGLALVCALGVVATMSRGAWINLAIAVSVYALLGRTKSTLVVVALGAAAMVAALAGAAGSLSNSAPELVELFGERTQLQGYDDDRFEKAREAWELGLRYPMGVGPGDITRYTGFSAMAPHNTYARIWAENGPAALLLFAAIMGTACFGAFVSWMRSRPSEGAAIAIALALFMGVLVNASVVDALHWRHFWVLMCLCVFSARAREPGGHRVLRPAYA